MSGIIVSDTSSLIILNKIGRLELLQSLFGQITITRIISEEFINPLPDFINIQDPKDNNYQKILESFLHIPEQILKSRRDDIMVVLEADTSSRVP